MAPLQNRIDAQSDLCLNSQDKNDSTNEQEDIQNNHKRPYCHQLSLPESIATDYTTASNSSSKSSSNNLSALGNSKSEAKSLRQSSNSLNPLVPVSSTSSIRSLSSNSSSTAKNDQNGSAAAASSAAATIAPITTEKEKKRKEVSSSRVKEFHRRFAQVSKDEKLINYFSCALVCDILWQGHLYISDQHFAFYSNLFGCVTKLVIPTTSVTKISKEKTAKIIPNAVGIATADERYLFASFISREAAFRLMCSVCPPMAPVAEIIKSPADIEICEEYPLEDDSSCSISGNESPPQITDGSDPSAEPTCSKNLTDQTAALLSSNLDGRLKDIPVHAKATTSGSFAASRASTPVELLCNVRQSLFGSPSPEASPSNTEAKHRKITSSVGFGIPTSIHEGCCSNTPNNSDSLSPSPSTSSAPTAVPSPYANGIGLGAGCSSGSGSGISRVKYECFHNLSEKVRTQASKTISYLSSLTEIQLIYFGIMLAVLLSFFSLFLLYRVINIEAKANLYGSPVDYPFIIAAKF